MVLGYEQRSTAAPRAVYRAGNIKNSMKRSYPERT